MAKFLWKANYTTEGVKGILNEGGTGRRAAVEQMTEALGGKVEAFYYAFGGDDVYVITELPDNTSAAAVSLAVNAAGAVRLETVQLLTAEEMDEATKKSVEYRPPGG